MLKGFKEFTLRGNVVDLAVAVVIGVAFGGLVAQFTKSFIEPLLKLIGGGGVQGGAFMVNGVAFDWAAFVNVVINFVIVAAVIYFLVVLPMNHLRERMAKPAVPAEPAPTAEEVALLREIRDLLQQRQSPPVL